MNILIVWDPTSATAYKIEYKLHSSPIWIFLTNTSSNYTNVTGLTQCEYYDFRITPICDVDGVSYGTPTILSNIRIDDYGQCNQNASWQLKVTNNGAQDPVDAVQVSNDLGSVTTTGMPVHNLSTYTQMLFMGGWSSNNFILSVSYLGGYSMFHVEAYRNGILEYTSPIFAHGGGGFLTWLVPIPMLHPPYPGDLIEFIINPS